MPTCYEYNGEHYEEAEFRALLASPAMAQWTGASFPTGDLPFKKSWPMLAMKRMIRWAAENGYDRVAWTPGEVQSNRYNTLLRDITGLIFNPNTNELLVETASRPDEHVRITGVTNQNLADYVGQGTAERLMSDDSIAMMEGDPVRRIQGGNIRVADKGMAGFYDQILPAETNKIIKKYGARVGKTVIGDNVPRTIDRSLVTFRKARGGNEARDWPNTIIANYKQEGYEVSGDGFDEHQAFVQLLQQHVRNLSNRVMENISAHSFDITPAMRQEVVEKGLPLYQEAKKVDIDWSRAQVSRQPGGGFVATLGSQQGQGATAEEALSALKKAYRRNLANPGTNPQARALVDITRATMTPPTRRTAADVQAEVDKKLEEDPAKQRKRLINLARRGGLYDDTDTVMAQRFINQEGPKVFANPTPEGWLDLVRLNYAYTRVGTEVGRSLQRRRDSQENPFQRTHRLLTDAIVQPDPNTRKALERAIQSNNVEQFDQLLREWADNMPALHKKLLDLGFDISKMPVYDAVEAAKALKVIQTAKATKSDKMFEYWRNSILSGIKTHAANTLGNFGHAGWHFTAERLTEAVVNLAVRDPLGAQVGEIPHVFSTLLPALSRAAHNALLTFQTELPQFARQTGRGAESKFDIPNVAIKGWNLPTGKLGRWAGITNVGEAVRIPQRLLLAADDFAETLFANLEATAYAYRIAKSEGKKGGDLKARMEELVADIESEAWQNAYEVAEQLTFKQEGIYPFSKMKEAVLKARRNWPAARYVLPFVTTPMNIFETAVLKSPLGSVRLGARIANKMAENYQKGNPIFQGLSKGNASLAAQQLLAWAAFLAIMGNNDEDDPWITGAEGTWTQGERTMTQRTGRQPQSIKIGGQWHSYARLEPFATILASMVDVGNALKRPIAEAQAGDLEAKELGQALNRVLQSAHGQMTDKTFLRGLGDVLAIGQYENTLGESVARYGTNFAVSWVPNITRQTGRAADQYLQQQGVWGDGVDWANMLARRTGQRMELPPFIPKAQETTTIYDLWGRPVPTARSFIPQTDWLYRATVPVENREEDILTGDRLMLAWNNQNPDEPKYGLPPRKWYTKGGIKKYFDEDQYEAFTRRSGEIARELVEARQWRDPDNPTANDMKALEKIIQRARKKAKHEVLNGQVEDAEASEAVYQ